VNGRSGNRPPARVIILAGAALVCAALLAGLGIWQVQRLQWKLDLIARVEARVNAEPVAAPGPSEWNAISPASHEYLQVRLHGRFLHDREALVQAVTDLDGGYWVITPLVVDDGFTVLVNRGFVTPQFRNSATRVQGAPEGENTVTGLLRMSEPGGGFLRRNDPQNDRWFSRDVGAITAARGLENAAPYFIDADATANAGGWPRGGLTRITFSNSHLVYAITWFTLMGMALAAAWYVLHEWRRRELRALRPPDGGTSGGE
jgi:surfeit locus 1 family protein